MTHLPLRGVPLTDGPHAAVSAAARVAALEAVFRDVAATRMAGVPVMHPRLRVQAVGFGPQAGEADAPGGALIGVLVTPWFMNVLRLPMRPVLSLAGTDPEWLRVGCTAPRSFGDTRLDFLGSFEAGFGVFEASSLFSPMFEFADHGAAVATAFEVLKCLRPVSATLRGAVGAPVEAPVKAQLGAAPPRWPDRGPDQAPTPLKGLPDRRAEAPLARRGFLLGRPSAGGRP